MATRPTDTLFPLQWYLFNTGQGGRTTSIDLNVIDDDPNTFDVWDEYTGKGVTVGVVDSGVEKDHPDLKSNYVSNPKGLPNYNHETDGKPSGEAHGTAVAGIIAASRDDGGVVGIAYNAKITGFLFTGDVKTALERQVNFDLSSNSWGPSGFSSIFGVNFNTALYQREAQGIETAAKNGRNGLGTVFLFAAGNSFEEGTDANYSNYTNSRYTLSVAAVNGDGYAASYSNQASSLLVSGFAEGSEVFQKDAAGNVLRDANKFPIPIPQRGAASEYVNIVTTDLTGNAGYNSESTLVNTNLQLDYTSSFNGTSAATPTVSGVVALMLEANPKLGYRDVQEILAYSAWQNNRTPISGDEGASEAWLFNGAKNWNGGGLHVNDNYGFGLVDAHAAVRLAETWQLQSTFTNEKKVSGNSSLRQSIPDNSNNPLIDTITLPSGLQIDHAEVKLDISHTAIEDLIVTLISPNGTESILFYGPDLSLFKQNKDIQDNDIEPIAFSQLRQNPDGTFKSFYGLDQNTDLNSVPLSAGQQYSLNLLRSYGQGINFTFSSTFNWGEISGGDWKLRITDDGNAGTGSLNKWDLHLYGDEITSSNTFFYTDEFTNFTNNATRQVLSDTNGGTDTINAAAITSGIVLNLTPGSTSTLAGNTFVIDSNTNIEQAFAGDGNDQITGNSTNNQLWGGRGSDTLIGGGGADILEAELGDDTYMLDATAAGSKIKDKGGIDSLMLAGLALSLADPAVGTVGLGRQNDTLLIDLNQDGTINSASDLSLEQFFDRSTDAAGTGFIENIGNLSGTDILNAAEIFDPSALTVTNNILGFDGGTGPAKLEFTLTGGDAAGVHEVGVFGVDDAQGTIIDPTTGNRLTPGSPGYTQAALDRGQSIFSVLPDRLGGANNTRIIEDFDGSDRLAFYLVPSSSTDNVLAGQTDPAILLFGSTFGTPGVFEQMQATGSGNGEITLSWEDELGGGDQDFNDLVLNVKLTQSSSPLGAKLQGYEEGELFDFTDSSLQNTQLQGNFTLNREADYNNTVCFYKILDAQGGIDESNDGIVDFRPGDAGYAQAAVRQRIANLDLAVVDEGTVAIASQLLGGSLWAPFIIANGTPDQFLNQNPNNQFGQNPLAYFTFLGANPDKVDHVRLLGDNIFGFEDVWGSGDQDFNDLVVRATFS